MKKSCVALLTIALISLSGCGGDDKKSVVGENHQTTPETTTDPVSPTKPETPAEPVTPTTPETPTEQEGGDTKQPDQKPISSITEAMDKLVELGAYPKLNRDKDVAGPDVDGNGVRDDLDAYVASLPDTEAQKKAMLQGFASLQYKLTVQQLNEETISKGIKLTISSIQCLYENYGMEASDKSKDIVMFTINTKERDDVYNEFNDAASGYTGRENRGDPCL